MANRVLDLAWLDGLWQDLRSVGTSFDQIARFDQALAHAVGDDELSGAVVGFGKSWDDRREVIGRSIDCVWEAARLCHRAFVQSTTFDPASSSHADGW